MYKTIVRPVLFRFDSERVHDFSVRAATIAANPLVRSLLSCLWRYQDPILQCTVFDRVFPNPLGLAAGFDKRSQMVPFLSAVGFGHVEVGTITPKPQTGNERPRIFRLVQDEAIINRMGFPSEGIEEALSHLEVLSRMKLPIHVGVNIGKNKATDLESAAGDYRVCARALGPKADWITINVSSPNTPGLRTLQTREALEQIVFAVREEVGQQLPVLVKLAPDLTSAQLEELLHVLVDLGVNGVIASNTTISREGLTTISDEAGGLSGPPLYRHTKARVAEIEAITEGSLPIIAVGGVHDWRQIVELLVEGASLVQIYTAFIYEGPAWPSSALKRVAALCKSQGLNSLSELKANREILRFINKM